MIVHHLNGASEIKGYHIYICKYYLTSLTVSSYLDVRFQRRKAEQI